MCGLNTNIYIQNRTKFAIMLLSPSNSQVMSRVVCPQCLDTRMHRIQKDAALQSVTQQRYVRAGTITRRLHLSTADLAHLLHHLS